MATVARRRRIPIPQIILITFGAFAFAFGYIGLSQYVVTLSPEDGVGTRWYDILYYDLQLFVLGSQALEPGPPYNVWLEIGRFLAIVTTVSGVTVAAAKLFEKRLLNWVNRHRVGHVVVVGETTAATIIADHFEAARAADGSKPRVLTIASGDEAALRGAGVLHAATVIACADRSAINVATARTALGLARRKELSVHVIVNDPTLGLILRAREIATSDNDRHPIYPSTLDELAARRHVRQAQFDAAGLRAGLLVVGASTFGRAIIVELAKRLLAEGRLGTDRIVLNLVDEQVDPANAMNEILDRYPFVGRIFEIKPLPIPLPIALVQLRREPYRSYFCFDNEELAQSSAIMAQAKWQTGPNSVVVRLSQLSPYGPGKAALLDDVSGVLDVVTVPVFAAQEIADQDDTTVALAKTIHQRYLDDAKRRGVAMGSTPYLRPWNDLTDEAREQDLAQARDFPHKLRLIGCTIAPRTSVTEDFTYVEGEIERLAKEEHERWRDERMAENWQYGPVRNEKRKINPLLVAWDQLPPEVQDLNREMVRQVPLSYDPVLAMEGLQIVRLAPSGGFPTPVVLDQILTDQLVERLARIIHERYVASRLSTREDSAEQDSMRAWEDLTDDLREANRAQARDIGRKLDEIDAYATLDVPDQPFAFTPEEIEILARREHERWMRERHTAGWTYGSPRDNDRKIHPSLVPWGYLPEAERNKDRESVRAICDIVAAAGLHVARRPHPQES